MNPSRIIGIILIVAGALGLTYGGFSYTKETTGMKIGPIELKVQEKETVAVPLIVSAVGIALGVFLLVGVGRK
jgi:multidrug transporter EmrE-like cation transporter